MASRAVMSDPLDRFPHNEDANRHPGDDAVPDREIFGGRRAANGRLADEGAAFQYRPQ